MSSLTQVRRIGEHGSDVRKQMNPMRVGNNLARREGISGGFSA
jgi:hypothetical protein